jgi:hypothetical protein
MKLTNDIKFVWDYFKGKGLTDYGIAGLMGNLYAESGLRSNALERLCIKRYAELGINFTDEFYTISVDSGAISKNEFLHPMGKHYGYGLAQWTTESRKRGLYDYCKAQNVSISDLNAQCEYLCLELEKAFKSTLNVLKTASDVDTASDYVLLHFEQPKDATSQIEIRRKCSNGIYNLLGGSMVIIGSARIDENGHASGGKAGDQSGKEVSTQKYYLHDKGWYVLRAKEPQVREAIAQNMIWACANNNIGYDQGQNQTLYQTAKPVGFNCSLVGTPCETDCARLVRVCVLYAGVQVSDFYTATEKDALLATNAFDLVNVALPDGLLRGDILVTKTKGHTVVVLTNGENARPEQPITTPTEYKLGWIKDGTNWYYRIGKGINAHGFNDIKCKDGNTYRFYFDDKGKMQTGWQHIGDYWYYFNDTVGSGLEGAMYISDKDGRQYIATF